MKKLNVILSVLATVVLSITAVAQTAFEGEIKLSTTNKELNETANVSWLIKGANHKMVFNTVTKGEPYSYTIIITENNMNAVMLAEVQGKKARYDIPLSSLNNAVMANYYKFMETGNTDNVAGYPTTQFVIEAPGTTTTCKIADVPGLKATDFPQFFKMGGVLKAITDKNYTGIPMSITTLDARTGELKSTQAIESISPRPIGANEFVIGPEWTTTK